MGSLRKKPEIHFFCISGSPKLSSCLILLILLQYQTITKILNRLMTNRSYSGIPIFLRRDLTMIFKYLYKISCILIPALLPDLIDFHLRVCQ